MRRLPGVVLALVLAMLVPGLSVQAAEPDLSTPDLAARSFLEALAAQDTEGMLATSAADDLAAGYRFGDALKRAGMWYPSAFAPSEYPLYAEINREAARARILGGAFYLAWNLLVEDPSPDQQTELSDAQVDFLMRDLDPAPLGRLRVLDSRFPDATKEQDQRYHDALVANARTEGASDSTERLVLVSLDDRLYEIGMRLQRYGDRWEVAALQSVLAGTSAYRPARPTTQEAYERHTSGDYSDVER